MKKIIKKLRYLLPILLMMALPTTASAQTEPLGPQEPERTGTVTGKIINASPGGEVPGLLELMLHAWDSANAQRVMLHGKSDIDGNFRLEDVPFDPGLLYVVMVSYDGSSYLSDPVSVDTDDQTLAFEVPIFDSTADISEVVSDQSHLLISFSNDVIRITEIYILSNHGEFTVKDVVPLDDGTSATLKFSLPENAANVSFPEDDQGRFIPIPGGFVDTAPLVPGIGIEQIVVDYLLPYSAGMELNFVPPVPTEKVFFLLPESSGVTLEGENLSSPVLETIQDGQNYLVYTMTDLKLGDLATFSLLGDPQIQSLSVSDPVMGTLGTKQASSKLGIALGGLVLGISMVGVGLWWWRRTDTEPDESDEAMDIDLDQILKEIVALDEGVRRGEIDREDYQLRRVKLRVQAKAVLEEGNHVRT